LLSSTTVLRRHPFLWTLLVVLLLVGTACQNTPTPQGNNPIKIGIVLSLTGDFQADGVLTQQGYQLWADDVNKNGGLLGRPVQLIIKNDASKPDQTLASYINLISHDHVDLVLGPFADDFTVAAGRAAKRYGYALLDGTGNSPSTYTAGLDNLFCVSIPAANYLQSFAQYILALPQGQRPKTVAYATSDLSFTNPQVQVARHILENGGLKTVLNDVYPQEVSDYTPIALKIIASHPDLVLLGTGGPQDGAPFIKTFVQQHFNNAKAIIETAGPDGGNQFTTPLTETKPDGTKVPGTSVAEGLLVPNGGWYPTAKTFQNSQFVAHFLAKFGGKPADISSDSVQAYSVGQVLAQTVADANSIDNAKLLGVLRSGTLFSSLQGPVQFAHDGENKLAVAFLFQWQRGNLIPVYPPQEAQANVEFPKPSWS
jgi:branched-chain amino acid transport system substrate-binding protein